MWDRDQVDGVTGSKLETVLKPELELEEKLFSSTDNSIFHTKRSLFHLGRGAKAPARRAPTEIAGRSDAA
ncbi:hypothetical protein EVAR_48557_1 [Eumeta japonica]|uniref:Uncharacterized protein n=1 Tax=Eumeta variegata TaxID=151549 RepID=A0A4C1Y9N0_EUMVA|nr:hypothetical protein EVAR_48557_1 [Eumeta japonica]